MDKKPAGGEFIKGFLERIGSEEGSSSLHTSVIGNASEGIRVRFRRLK